ncbi:hypothetical protein AB0L06_15460 [Spirillospora sp. NPDC052269]
MIRTAEIVAIVLVGIPSADSRRSEVINQGTPAWRAGFSGAATEITAPPPRREGGIVLAFFSFSGPRNPYARCSALFEVKHVEKGDIPAWPMPAPIRPGTKTGLEYKAGWIERCLRDRPR